MRPVQKTLVDFDKIEAYARTVEFLHNKQAATDLRNVKKDILAVYDKQASQGLACPCSSSGWVHTLKILGIFCTALGFILNVFPQTIVLAES